MKTIIDKLASQTTGYNVSIKSTFFVFVFSRKMRDVYYKTNFEVKM